MLRWYLPSLSPIHPFSPSSNSKGWTSFLSCAAPCRRRRISLSSLSTNLPSPVPGMAAAGQSWNGQTLAREVLINYLGPPRTVKTVSYYQALDYEHLLPPGIFAGKIILVGRSLQATPEPQRLSSDTFLTPFSLGAAELVSGVEIQATLIGNLLQDSFVSAPDKSLQWSLLFLLQLASSLLVIRLKPVGALL